MGKFKEFDTQTHDGAHEMEKAARAAEGMKVIDLFNKVQAGCLGCHQMFRASFTEYFTE